VRLYSYIVARDYGFAPNPFFGACTLATCKPEIRRTANVGDWIIGTGAKRYGLGGRLVYAMKVAEAVLYEQYWEDDRFRQKKPYLRGSLKQAFGDNIYHRNPKTGEWLQEDSHHSYPNGRPNQANIDHDTQVSRVLVGMEFKYWGASGPTIPNRFRHSLGHDVCCTTQGHKCNFPNQLVRAFTEWVQTIREVGHLGEPAEFEQQLRR
jgi:hypothetical protein